MSVELVSSVNYQNNQRKMMDGITEHALRSEGDEILIHKFHANIPS